MICQPPQTGKTELVSRRLPAFLLGRNPDMRIIACSHSSNLSELLNHEVQNIMDEEDYLKLFPDARIAERGGKHKRTADYFEMEGRRGCLRSAGVRMKIAGQTAECGIIDDPIGTMADASSPTMRQHVWEWIAADFLNRLPKHAPVILCQTRWHMDDPAGRFLNNMANGAGDRWEIVCLPSLHTGHKTHERDPRHEGEALWPDHMDTRALLKLKELNPRSFAALHQQNPMAAGSEWPAEWFGPDVWFDDWPDPTESDRVVSLDSSMGIGGKMGDYSAFVKMARHKGLFYVEADMANDRNTVDIVNRAVQIQREFRARLFGIEAEFGGGALGENMREHGEVANILMPLVTVNTRRPNEAGEVVATQKELRIRWLGTFLGPKMFRFKLGSPATRLLVQQLMEFPNGEHDDGPDAMEMAMQLFKDW
jgi:predicted phage terminase large subunit-like protein